MAIDASLRPRMFAALAQVAHDRLAEVVNRFLERYPLEMTSLPTSGLAMMRIRESVNGEPFNIGEIPLSSASVLLELPSGDKVSGAGQVMADDADLAVWMAVCDAAVRHNLPGSEPIEALIHEGFAILQNDQDVRQSILNRTKVRFSLLNEETGS